MMANGPISVEILCREFRVCVADVLRNIRKSKGTKSKRLCAFNFPEESLGCALKPGTESVRAGALSWC
jgi:hypothetical protein